MLFRHDLFRLCFGLSGCWLASASATAWAAATVHFDTTVTPADVRFTLVPGTSMDTWTYAAEATFDMPLQGLAANQTYHLTLHTTPGEAFRLDAAVADLEIILYSQNRTPTNGQSSITATNIGTVRLAGQNVTGSPLQANLRDETAFGARIGTSLSAPSTFALVKSDPGQQALVTELTFDFTLPASFVSPASPVGPFDFEAVDLAGTQTVPHGQTASPIAGFARVPEPAAVAPLAVIGFLMRRRRGDTGERAS